MSMFKISKTISVAALAIGVGLLSPAIASAHGGGHGGGGFHGGYGGGYHGGWGSRGFVGGGYYGGFYPWYGAYNPYFYGYPPYPYDDGYYAASPQADATPAQNVPQPQYPAPAPPGY